MVITRRGGPETADKETFRLVAETETVFLGGVVDGAEGGGVISEGEGDLEVFEVGFGVLVHGVGNNSNKFNEYILVLVWLIISGPSNRVIVGDKKID